MAIDAIEKCLYPKLQFQRYSKSTTIPIDQEMSNRKKKPTTLDKENDEVEELLRAAEEDIFLKLNLNSHTLRGSSSQTIPLDLDRRFHSLKSNSISQPQIPIHPTTQQPNTTHHADDHDFLGRFEALKKTLPSYQDHGIGGSVGGDGGEEEEEEDEVEKVIRWAMDAARLNPEESDDDDDDDDDESDDDYDSEEDNVKKKSKKGKP